MSTPEGNIKRKLDRMLKSFGPDLWYFSPQAGPYGSAGIPDRVVCVRGTFIGVECKADASKKITPLQDACRLKIEKAGGVYFLVYDADSIVALRVFIASCLR